MAGRRVVEEVVVGTIASRGMWMDGGRGTSESEDGRSVSTAGSRVQQQVADGRCATRQGDETGGAVAGMQ